MVFTLMCTDKPNSLPIRQANRQEHLDYLKKFRDSLYFSGALLDTNQDPNGDLIVIEMADRSAVDNFIANDPYTIAGLFAEVKVVETIRT